MKAIIKNQDLLAEGYTSANIPNQLGCCTALFEIGKSYPAIIDHELYVGYNGDLVDNTSIVIYDGSLDGCDRANGVKFTFIGHANRYFTFYED